MGTTESLLKLAIEDYEETIRIYIDHNIKLNTSIENNEKIITKAEGNLIDLQQSLYKLNLGDK